MAQSEIDAFVTRLVLDARREPHFKFKTEEMNLRDAEFARGINGEFALSARDGRVHRTDQHKRIALVALEGRGLKHALGLIGLQDQSCIMFFFLRGKNLPLLLGQSGVNTNKILPLIFAQIQNFKRAIGLVLFFQFTLNADEAFA